MEFIQANKQKQTFQNLFNLYVYELSFLEKMLQQTLNNEGVSIPPKGIDAYLDVEGKEANLIYENDKLIGFVIFVNTNNTYCLDEIFILPSYRKQGIASRIIQEYIKDAQGVFTTHILKQCKETLTFFENFFTKNNYTYIKSERDAIAFDYKINL